MKEIINLEAFMNNQKYSLRALPYDFNELEPGISSRQLRVHYEKHHRGYVDAANEILETMTESRGDGSELAAGVMAKKLSFNFGGIALHNLFWDNLQAPDGQIPEGVLLELLENEYGEYDRFKSEFYEAATTIEGSGWAALFYCRDLKRPLIGQIQNHNLNIYPEMKILLVLDMWEHAYYLDYQNDKKAYAEKFWQMVNWQRVGERYKSIK